MEKLEKATKETEGKIFENPDRLLIMELNKLKAKYNVLSTNKATKSLMRLKQSYYEQGERAGKLLAWRIKQMQAERAINSILTDKGDTTSDPKEINDTFQCFYQNLYGSKYSGSASGLQKYFLDTLKFDLVDKEFLGRLDRNLETGEISEAISGLGGGKTPGPDAIPIEIYKIFKSKLIPPLLDMYKESFDGGSLPPSLNKAIISLLLKPGKTPT